MRRMLLGLVAIWTLHALAAEAEPAATPAVAPACAAAEYRQFDFWLGDWDVTNARGEPVGRNSITRVAQGCALHENWSGRGGFSGQSLNGWNKAKRRWEQTWIDSGGGRLDLAGGADGDGMRLEGSSPDDDEPTRLVQHRIRWSPLPDGRVRQHWETSKDGGATWSTAFDGYYRRR